MGEGSDGAEPQVDGNNPVKDGKCGCVPPSTCHSKPCQIRIHGTLALQSIVGDGSREDKIRLTKAS